MDSMTETNAKLRSELQERLRFETLLVELSAKLINLPAGEIDRQIEDAQRQVCESLGLDLASLWQWRPDNLGMLSPTHHYRPLGGPPRCPRRWMHKICPRDPAAGAGRENRGCFFDGRLAGGGRCAPSRDTTVLARVPIQEW